MADPLFASPNIEITEPRIQGDLQTSDVLMNPETTSKDTLMQDCTSPFDEFLHDSWDSELDFKNISTIPEAPSPPSPNIDGPPKFEIKEASERPIRGSLPLNVEQQTGMDLEFQNWEDSLIHGYVASSENVRDDSYSPAANYKTGTSEEIDLRRQFVQLSDLCAKLDQKMQQMQRQVQFQYQIQQRCVEQLEFNQMAQKRQLAAPQRPFPSYGSPFRYNPGPLPQTHPRFLGVNDIISSNLDGLNNPEDKQNRPSPFRRQAHTLPPHSLIDPALLQSNPQSNDKNFNFDLYSGSSGNLVSSLDSFPRPNDICTIAPIPQLSDGDSKGTGDTLGSRSTKLTKGDTQPRQNILKTSGRSLKKVLPDTKTRVTKRAKIKNNRKQKIAEFKPEDHYAPLSSIPGSWAGEGSKCKFRYNARGELIPGESFSVAQITDYLYKHPLHGKSDSNDTRESSGLRIWIQRAPTDALRRFTDEQSLHCRFEKCVIADRRILVGHPRLAFDEQSHKTERFDPFIYAGFVHLYCAEKFLDLPSLVQNLDIRVDDRMLDQETDGANRMKLEYHMLRVARTFVKICLKETLPSGYPDSKELGQWHYRGTLCHRLWRAKLDNEFPVRAEARAVRGDRPTQWPNHLGDLEELEMAKTKKRRLA